VGIELPAARPWREAELEQRTNELVWEQIARLHETETAFDTHVGELMVRKFPTAQAAAPLAIGKSAVEFPLLRNLNDAKGAPLGWRGEHDRPIYFFELRDRYVCSWCELHDNDLILVPSRESGRNARHVRYPNDVTIVGRSYGNKHAHRRCRWR
jgi:hypothetical protein